MRLLNRLSSVLKYQWLVHFLIIQIFLKLLRLPHAFFNEWNIVKNHFGDFFNSFILSFYTDLPVLVYFFSPLWVLHILFRKGYMAKRIALALCILFVTLLTTIDVLYYPYTGTHINIGIFATISDHGNNISSYILSYGWAIPIIILFTWLFYKIPIKNLKSLYPRDAGPLKKIGLGLIYTVLLFLAARGGTMVRPFTAINLARVVPHSMVGISNSAPFEILSTLGVRPVIEPTFGQINDLNWIHNYKGGRKKNVCLIIVESLGKEYLELDSGRLTPFINSLRSKSIDFEYCFATGRRSKEMPPSIFLGLPKLMSEDYASGVYSRNKAINAFGLYGNDGYKTSFWHGGHNGTMEFESFLKQGGLESYMGMDQYPYKSDYDGGWGIYDMPYLQQFAQGLKDVKKPFFYSMFTLSTHHPYKINEPWATKLPKGPYENSQTIRYIDTSLALFFKSIQNESWYKNTLFVITADHTSLSKNFFYAYAIGKFWIPFIVYDTGNEKGVTIKTTVGHNDIMSTINALSGVKGAWYAAGNNGLDIGHDNMVVLRNDVEYSCIQYPYLLNINWDGEPLNFYLSYKGKRETPLKKQGPQYEKMLKYSRNYVRQFHHKIINNAWFIK